MALWKNSDLLCLWFPLSTFLGKGCVVPLAPYPTHLTCSLILPITQLTPHSPPGPHAARAASLLGISSPSPHCCVSSPHLEAQMQASSFPKAFLLSHPRQPQPPEPASPSFTLCPPRRFHCGRHWMPNHDLWMGLSPHWPMGPSREGQVLFVSVSQRYVEPPTQGGIR